MAEAAGTGFLDLLRVGSALVIVLVLALLAARLARRGIGARGSRMRVEERLVVARGTQLAVVAVDGRRLVLGVSDRAVSLLTELDPLEEPARAAAPAAAGWLTTLAEATRALRTGRARTNAAPRTESAS
ncbi:MAG: flagellar biosynthetic protein FliO [Acidobacteria bacterium]|nr:flagellar biosynthetic protein FliO [Acidobacteriota bacterium]